MLLNETISSLIKWPPANETFQKLLNETLKSFIKDPSFLPSLIKSVKSEHLNYHIV